MFFLGGLALVGIGLAVGLIIGGWPGLLSGLALGVPGYLFLGRGYAGSWNSAARPLRTSTRVAAAHPADGIDALGRFLVKVTVAVASVFLATLVLGLIFGSSAAAVIGGIGLALVAVLALVLLNA
ncbi:hypothetical protein DLM85_08195 [Hymenobacter edaphi]|uniref:Uncharacterized protein n=1 Tax=Hymenobacter edaphi TaxID=2211146 RepID=A0A328BLM8_9BACT|nr:hypothetical protein DLM85_08195 [Hymenobacter edaphi]